jgi:hypothetical protein
MNGIKVIPKQCYGTKPNIYKLLNFKNNINRLKQIKVIPKQWHGKNQIYTNF